MESQMIFAALRDALAVLYPDVDSARRVADDAGINLGQINFNSGAINFWHALLAEAVRTSQIDALLEMARSEYGSQVDLATADDTYRRFVAQGGQLVAPAQSPGQGDMIYGDKVGGGKITTGDISAPTAIGAGASVTIIKSSPPPRIPLQRPPRAEHFQDRKTELAKLLDDLQPGQVVTLCGPGGIGKTALAAEAVWQLAPGEEPPARFPHGILFHSFYNQGAVALALAQIARTFGEETKPTPREAAQRALAGRRVLLILDGAEQADDLRQVLEIRDQAGVLVTSRQRQDAVAERQDVTPLPPADAVTLLQAWGGTRAAEASAAERISELVGRLPLALRLVGRFLAQNAENATDYLTWLATTPLEALNQGDRREQSVSVLLARSLAQVSESARQVVGVIGLLALAPFERETLVATLELSPPAARQALGELVNYGLLLRPAERYEVSHALIHTYARLELPPPIALVERLAAHYTTLIKEHASDFALLHTIRPHVMALLRIGGERQAWTAVNDLARAIDRYLDLQGFWIDRIAANEAGLAAAQARQDRRGEGGRLGSLGNAYADLGQVEQAKGYYEQALAIAQEIGDRQNEGTWLGNLGLAYATLGQVAQAIGYYEQALAIAQEIGDRRGEGDWLGTLGNGYRNLGQVAQAIGYYQQSLAIAQEIGDRRREGTRLGSLGNAYADLGQVEQAIGYYQQALAIAQEIGDRRGEGARLGSLGNAYRSIAQFEQAIVYFEQALMIVREIKYAFGEGEVLKNLGSTYHDLRKLTAAQEHWEDALQIFETIKSPNADTVRQWLSALQNK